MLAKVSPTTAFLPCPIVKGPVGFALTNSTIAFFSLYFLVLPYSSFSVIILVIILEIYSVVK